MNDQLAQEIVTKDHRETEFRRELRRAVRVMIEARWPVLALSLIHI